MELTGANILVTGGTGSFGRRFVGRVLEDHKPDRVIVYSRDELKQFQMRQQFPVADFPTLRMFIGDVRDRERLYRVMDGVDIVVHAAALKQIPAAELNPLEAIKTNILGAANIIDIAFDRNVGKVIALSTDKAANPVNMMGASKRIMEIFLMQKSTDIDISTARFANVAFSDGSLLHGFTQRINKKQPLSAPSDVRRYFVTSKEAGELCLLSGLLGKNREIFFPKLSPELNLISFNNIAIKYLDHLGYKPVICETEDDARKSIGKLLKEGKWPCYFFNSDTTGEKDFEEFFTEKEAINLDRFVNIGVIKSGLEFEEKKLEKFLFEIE